MYISESNKPVLTILSSCTSRCASCYEIRLREIRRKRLPTAVCWSQPTDEIETRVTLRYFSVARYRFTAVFGEFITKKKNKFILDGKNAAIVNCKQVCYVFKVQLSST